MRGAWLWLLASVAWADPRPNPWAATTVDGHLHLPVNGEIDSRVLHLSNGLLLVVESDPLIDRVATSLIVDVGRAEEAPRGTAEVARRILEARAVGLGVDVDFATSDDYTRYSLVGELGAEDRLLDFAFGLIGDPLADATSAEVATAMEATRRHRIEAPVTTWGRRFPFLAAQLFPADHPYAVLDQALSYPEAVGLDNVRTLSLHGYAPDRITMVVSVPEPLVPVVRAHAAAAGLDLSRDLEVNGPSRAAARAMTPPDPVGPRVRSAVANVPAPEVVLGWTLPSGYQLDPGTNWLVARVLAGHLQLRSEAADCSAIDSARAAILLCAIPSSGLDEAELAALLPNARQVNRHAREAADALSLNLLMTADVLPVGEFGRPAWTARYAHFTGETAFFSAHISGLARAAPEVSNYMARWVSPERMRVVDLRPVE